MSLFIISLFSPLLLLCVWLTGRLLCFVFNYQIHKYYLRKLPAISDPFARLKALAKNDPTTSMLEMNTKLAGTGKAFLPVVFVGPFLDMGRPLVMLNSPDLIKEASDDTRFPKLPAIYDTVGAVTGFGLSTAKGANWKKRRDIINQVFLHNKIKIYGKAFTARTTTLIETLRSAGGTEVNCLETITEITMGALIDSLFANTGLDPQQISRELQKTTSIGFAYSLSDMALGSTLNAYFPWKKLLEKTKAGFKQNIVELCSRARNNAFAAGENLIAVLALAKDEQGNPTFTDSEIAEDVMLMFVAGNDTSKSVIAWALYFLCENKQELELLQQEADRVLKGRTATMDDIPQLPKCKNAIMECMRLRPPGPALERVTSEDTMFGGYVIPKRTSLMLNIHSAHMDPTLWEVPEEFRPSRFDNSGTAANFFAFSYGPRNCIGQKFALTETVIIIASLVQAFDLYKGSGKVHPLVNIAQEPAGFTCKFVPR